ncbi:MAG: 4Fe-4S dicluster domain-containing protein, partial [Candidatus Helarchaeota archaeon]
YCKECFVDQNNPQWFGKTANLPDNILFHLIRAIHLAGRCVGCGACTRACPMNINLYLLNKKIRNVVEERFNFRAGLDVEKVCPLAVYNMEDPQEFIITEEGE